MKKFFFLAAAMCAAVSMNAQTTVTKVLSDVANYVDFQALSVSNPDILTQDVPTTSEQFIQLPNGTKLFGFTKSDGTPASFQWNTKEDYNTTLPTPAWEGVDSLTVGTMWRAASGLTMALGELVIPAGGSQLQVFYQPNGDSDRGVEIFLAGTSLGQFTGSGKKLNNIRPAYVAEVNIPAGGYAAGDIVIKLISNTSNIFGVGITNLSTSLLPMSVTPKATKMVVDGQMIIVRDGVKYNALGTVVE